jgi:hypothetical protein
MPQIRDPRKLEVMLWLSPLEGEQRLVMLLAMKFAFPYSENDREWSALIKRGRDDVKPTANRHAEIILRAGRIAGNLKEELAAA